MHELCEALAAWFTFRTEVYPIRLEVSNMPHRCFNRGVIVSIYDMPWFTLTIFHISVELVSLCLSTCNKCQNRSEMLAVILGSGAVPHAHKQFNALSPEDP